MLDGGMKLKNVWIVEDDEGSCFVYKQILESNYQLQFFGDLKSFQSALDGRKIDPDLVIVDLQLPDGSFLNFLDQNRNTVKWKELPPYVVVSSADDVESTRSCYEWGALDYITKPFGHGELLVKLERLLAPKSEDSDEAVAIDPLHRTIRINGSSPSLMTSKEIQIISILVKAPNLTLSRQELVESVWGQLRVASKTLDVHLSNIRKKLEPMGADIRFVAPHSFRLEINRGS